MNDIELMKQIGASVALAAQKTKLTDQEALKTKNLQKPWRSGEDVEPGDRRTYNDKLYKVREGQGHTTQDDWTPDKTPTMWELIDEEHAGTQEDPIPYSAGMQLYSGQYYIEDDILYLCNRDTGKAVYQKLSELVDIYVKIAFD